MGRRPTALHCRTGSVHHRYGLDLTVTVANILGIYAEASADDQRAGAGWYPATHSLATELDPANVLRGAAVVASLSPLRSWPQNARLARMAYALAAEGRVTDTPTMGDQRRKLARLFAGEDPRTVIVGQKTAAFMSLIFDPSDPFTVCVDRHALAIYRGRVLAKDEQSIGKRVYAEVADAYREAAHGCTGVAPMRLHSMGTMSDARHCHCPLADCPDNRIPVHCRNGLGVYRIMRRGRGPKWQWAPP
jgi:hypothetical protein